MCLKPTVHSVANDAVIAERCIAADDDAAEVIDPKAFTELHFARKLNSCHNLAERLEKLVEERKREPSTIASGSCIATARNDKAALPKGPDERLFARAFASPLGYSRTS